MRIELREESRNRAVADVHVPVRGDLLFISYGDTIAGELGRWR